MHKEFVVSEGTGIHESPCLRGRQWWREWRVRLQQPMEGSAEDPGAESQLQLINRILSEQGVRQDSSTQQSQTNPAFGDQLLQRFAPAGCQSKR